MNAVLVLALAAGAGLIAFGVQRAFASTAQPGAAPLWYGNETVPAESSAPVESSLPAWAETIIQSVAEPAATGGASNAAANLSAFLRVVRVGEGTADANGYRRIFGGQLFDSFADHPRVRVPFYNPMRAGPRGVPNDYSTAAGAYQAISTTWDDFIRARGPHDFSPASQDAFALWCIERRGALADVYAGRFEAAIAKCAKEWASLPGSPYGQPTKTLDQARATYTNAGGTYA